MKVNKFKKTVDRLLLLSDEKVFTMDEKKSKVRHDVLCVSSTPLPPIADEGPEVG